MTAIELTAIPAISSNNCLISCYSEYPQHCLLVLNQAGMDGLLMADLTINESTF
jgi:hypothetical protein